MRWRILFCLFPVCGALAQDVTTTATPRSEKDSIRAYYIKSFPDHFFIYPVLKQRSLSFEIEKENQGRLVTYKPNNAYSIGVGAYLFEVAAELAFTVPIEEKDRRIFGESSARDLQLNVLAKSWGVDLIRQKYTGFYVTDSEKAVAANTPYPQRTDVDTRNIGITGHYLFNNQRFSFRSAYNFVERQVYSKGSWLLFSSISSFRMSADSSILNIDQESTFGNEVAFKYLRYTTFSVAPGYTYSMTYNGFFLNGTLSVGPAHHWINYRLETGRARDEITVNSFVAARIGLGYNGTRIFGGITFITQGSNVRFEDVRFSNNNGTFKILLGYRFREHGVLKKRAWDMVPLKL